MNRGWEIRLIYKLVYVKLWNRSLVGGWMEVVFWRMIKIIMFVRNVVMVRGIFSNEIVKFEWVVNFVFWIIFWIWGYVDFCIKFRWVIDFRVKFIFSWVLWVGYWWFCFLEYFFRLVIFCNELNFDCILVI